MRPDGYIVLPYMSVIWNFANHATPKSLYISPKVENAFLLDASTPRRMLLCGRGRREPCLVHDRILLRLGVRVAWQLIRDDPAVYARKVLQLQLLQGMGALHRLHGLQ